MKTLYILYHMARADFLERTRRYSFLIMLGLALFLGYSVASGQLVLVIGSNYRGLLNSAWVGGLMAVMSNFFLGWFGFYLVKGSVGRDYETGVGQIMATTPLSRPLYTLGKWLSNFAVLGIMVVVLMAVAVAMQLIYREDPLIDPWALLAPFLLLVLPFLALVAALAVLFETIEWLRGGLGNVIYFFLYMMVIVMLSVWVMSGASPMIDPVGAGILSNSMGQAAKVVYPDYSGGFNITWLVPEFETFRWDGIVWTSKLVVSRLALVLAAFGISILSAVFFDRFNPSRILPAKRKKTGSGVQEPPTVAESIPVSTVHLTPLANAQRRVRFETLLVAELKLSLKGQRWWWYAIAISLIIAQLFSELGVIRILLVASWVWPILILSGLGCREVRHDTRQIVFSAPRPIASQLPGAWLSSFVILALMGSGALLRFIIAGETFSILGWLTGVLFIPSLALTSGVLTGSSKAFEAIYVLWMYMLVQKAPSFDFIGMTPESPLYIYVPLALILWILAVAARRQQMKSR